LIQDTISSSFSLFLSSALLGQLVQLLALYTVLHPQYTALQIDRQTDDIT